MRDVGEELVLHAPRFEQRDVLPLELRVRLDERGVRAAQILDQPRLLRRRRHLVGDHAQQRARLRR